MSFQATSTDKAASNSKRVHSTEEQAQDLRRCVEILSPVVQNLVEDALKADTTSLDVISHNLQCALDEVRKIYPRVSGMRLPTDHDERLLSIETILTYVEFKFNARNVPRPEIHQRLFPIAMETLGYLRQVKSECDYEEYNRLNPIQEFTSGPIFSEAVTKELEEYPDFTYRGMM